MKRTLFLGISIFAVAALLLVLPLAPAPVMADDDSDTDTDIVITLFGIGPGAGASGTVTIENNPNGPDELELEISGLPPNQQISVFLTENQDLGALPAQFIGEFTTDDDGDGELELDAEIVDAFASANQAVENALGVAPPSPPPSPGTRPFAGGTANTIPLNWFRGYFVTIFPHNVFGPNETTPGGAIAFLSVPALP